jgi:hypothetical protein
MIRHRHTVYEMIYIITMMTLNFFFEKKKSEAKKKKKSGLLSHVT